MDLFAYGTLMNLDHPAGHPEPVLCLACLGDELRLESRTYSIILIPAFSGMTHGEGDVL
jgi:hypothetical protein